MPPYEREVMVGSEAVRAAGAAIMAIYETATVYRKADGSEVTDADLASDRIIRGMLRSAFPEDAILTEEGKDDPSRLSAARCWIVDPIDGTAAFVRRTGDFDVYLALVERERPVVAVTLQPAIGLMLSATAGGGCWLTRPGTTPDRLIYAPAGAAPRIATRPWLGAPGNLPLLRAAAARIGGGAVAFASEEGLNVRSFLPPDRLAEAIVGRPVPGSELDAWEWDLAAVDLIVREAGGCSTTLEGDRLRFNQPDPRLREGFVWSVDPATHDRVLTAVATARAAG